jgi:hypothetical protein
MPVESETKGQRMCEEDWEEEDDEEGSNESTASPMPVTVERE